MKLLYSLGSPYARKVRIVASEKRIEIEMVQVVLNAADCPAAQYNPLGKIPVLILDDGDTLFDSRVIVEYLDHRTPVAHLIPQDHTLKIQVRRWEALADGVCDAAILAIQEGRRPEDRQDVLVITKQRGKVDRGLAALNQEIGGRKWCVGENFSLADISLGCMLGYLALRMPEIDLAAQYPSLARHYAELMKRKAFADTIPS